MQFSLGIAAEVVPDLMYPGFYLQSLLPAVRHFAPIGPSHGIFRGAKFAQENTVTLAAFAPVLEALTPPTLKQLHPFLILWKIEL